MIAGRKYCTVDAKVFQHDTAAMKQAATVFLDHLRHSTTNPYISCDGSRADHLATR